MTFTKELIERNRAYFAAKLAAEKSLHAVVQAVKGQAPADFVLLDARPRDAYARAHIPGALCVPTQESGSVLGQLPRDKELVTYCWSDT